TTMYGHGFIKSSKMAFYAIASNFAQVGTVAFLGGVVTRIGQIMVTVFCSLIAFSMLNAELQSPTKALTSIAAPFIFVVIFSFIISGVIMNIYDVAVDTLLVSYCQDKKRLTQRGEEGERKRTSN